MTSAARTKLTSVSPSKPFAPVHVASLMTRVHGVHCAHDRQRRKQKRPIDVGADRAFVDSMERDTRFELATSTLARLHSTTELVPPSEGPFPR